MWLPNLKIHFHPMKKNPHGRILKGEHHLNIVPKSCFYWKIHLTRGVQSLWYTAPLILPSLKVKVLLSAEFQAFFFFFFFSAYNKMATKFHNALSHISLNLCLKWKQGRDDPQTCQASNVSRYSETTIWIHLVKLLFTSLKVIFFLKKKKKKG